MFRNYLAAALRNAVRNRLYAAINIAGLSVGLAAALLIALFVRDELSYDRWIPGHERAYLLKSVSSSPATSLRPALSDGTDNQLASALRLAFPQVEVLARLNSDEVTVRHGEVEAIERIYWADQDTFKVLPLPAVTGDPATALDRPDAIVLTRSTARKYFGREDVVGEALDINRRYPMTVTAVLEDLPSNTNLDRSIWAAASAPFSPLTAPSANFRPRVLTFVRLAGGTGLAEFQNALPGFVERLPRLDSAVQLLTLEPTPIAELHLSPPTGLGLKARGSRTVLMAVSAIGALILLVASINFINLMTACAARRATEVGARKVSGAERRHLVFQFLGETLIYVFFGAAAAVGLAQLLTPEAQTFLGRDTFFQYWREPAFMFGLAGVTAALGFLAGLYPAFVLSAFRPAHVLKSAALQGSGSSVLRRLLTTVQFAVLIGLILATGVVYQQTRFAFTEGMRMDTDQTLIIRTSCQDIFRDQVRALPGVAAAGCSRNNALNFGSTGGLVFTIPDGSKAAVGWGAVDSGFFDVYGLRPLAGRVLSERDAAPRVDLAVSEPKHASIILINEAAARRFGFSSPAMAIGQTLPFEAAGLDKTVLAAATIVGVVPDFALNAVDRTVAPAIYWAAPSFFDVLNVKLTGRDIPETLAAIDGLWKELGEPRPIARTFLDQRLEDMYRGITSQAQAFAVLAAVAVFIACLGVFALAAFTAERRAKEVGVRKAMGASTGDILCLLLWDFSKPVLWANIVAWPVGYLLMRRWLEGFAYHIDLAPWIFLAASTLALIIAVITVVGQALLVARAHPVTALRYE
jgi:putative ABC transport system permease protein